MEKTVQLENEGWQLGKTTVKEVVLSQNSVGDYLDAEAKQLPPLEAGVFMLARQIRRVNGEERVFTVELLRTMPASVLVLLHQASNTLLSKEGKAALGKR